MNNITGYSEKTSHHELYSLLSQKVVSGELDTYAKVIAILDLLPKDKRVLWVYPRIFALVRSIYWGFLKDLDKERFPDMWKTFVIEDPKYPGTGKLKRNSNILTLFAGIMDIHGYTSFCQKAGRNLSMLQLLDDCIQKDIKNIAASHGVVCQRSRGDEIILMGCRASSVFFTAMNIIDYFGRKQVIHHKGFQKARTGNRIMLPDMKVSAGIAGGNKYTPILITSNGDLSGHLINSAARLQSRANKLAPDDTKILMTRQVLTKLKLETEIDPDIKKKLEGMYFRNSGGVEFKGTQMRVIDVIFKKNELYKRNLDKGFARLYEALEKEMWERQIYEETLSLIRAALTHMEQFVIITSRYGKVRNLDIISLCNRGLEEFLNANQFEKALETMNTIYRILREIPVFDPLLLEYLEEITACYESYRLSYEAELEKVLEEKTEFLLDIDMRDLYLKAKKEVETYNRIRKIAIENPKVGNRKALWL
ncbi:MAG: hypothetical protein JXB03_02310, partial [Spirochaetales bacterium]|nr:hypothetical protein [Spirochaetales bacterium]